MKKIVSIALMIFGVAIFIFGSRASNEASQGEQRISQAQQDEQGHRRPILGPVRRNVNNQVANTEQEKISNAEQEVAASRVTADWLQGLGIVLAVIGLAYFVFETSRSRRSH